MNKNTEKDMSYMWKMPDRAAYHLVSIMSREEIREQLPEEPNYLDIMNYVLLLASSAYDVLKAISEKLPQIESDINHAAYLNCKGETNEAQKIYQQYAQEFLTLYKTSPEDAEAQYEIEAQFRREGLYNTKLFEAGTGMYVAITELSNAKIDSPSYSTLCELAKHEVSTAIFGLKTENNPLAQQTILDLNKVKNKYALAQITYAVLQGESWIEGQFVWTRNSEDEIKLAHKDNATNILSDQEAADTGLSFALDKFLIQQDKQEIIDRIQVIKRIQDLDLDIEVPDEKMGSGSEGERINAIEIDSEYDCNPILPNLEKQTFEKVTQALDKYPEWKKAKILIAECYKLGIGTERSIVKAIKELTYFDTFDYGNDSPINYVDPCWLYDDYSMPNILKKYSKALSKEHDVSGMRVTKEKIGNGVILYPDCNEVFIPEQQWLAKYMIPIMQVNLKELNPDWASIDLPLCIAYEPEGEIIGDSTVEHHNNYSCKGWFAFKLTDDNQYEFLGNEKYFKSATNEISEYIKEIMQGM